MPTGGSCFCYCCLKRQTVAKQGKVLDIYKIIDLTIVAFPTEILKKIEGWINLSVWSFSYRNKMLVQCPPGQNAPLFGLLIAETSGRYVVLSYSFPNVVKSLK